MAGKKNRRTTRFRAAAATRAVRQKDPEKRSRAAKAAVTRKAVPKKSPVPTSDYDRGGNFRRPFRFLLPHPHAGTIQPYRSDPSPAEQDSAARLRRTVTESECADRRTQCGTSGKS